MESNRITELQKLIQLEQIIFNLSIKNLDDSVQQTICLLDKFYIYSSCDIICSLINFAFSSLMQEHEIYLKYLQLIQENLNEINDVNIIKKFIRINFGINSQESYYLIGKIIESDLIDSLSANNLSTKYFSHYNSDPMLPEFYKENYEELKKNNFELHKKLIKEGVNPNEIAKIIRNDDIEKLQEISSHPKFRFNQIIKPSLYERCSYINQSNTLLIDYAAYFGSIKCFKYLLMNGAIVNNTGRYAIADGNLEIIHLCLQYHSIFSYAFETAIKFHRNDIFKYFYENQFERLQNNKNMYKGLVEICLKYNNFVIIQFLIEKGMNIDENIINLFASSGNLFLVKHFLDIYPIPTNILSFASNSGNCDLVNLILDYEGIDINNIYLKILVF